MAAHCTQFFGSGLPPTKRRDNLRLSLCALARQNCIVSIIVITHRRQEPIAGRKAHWPGIPQNWIMAHGWLQFCFGQCPQHIDHKCGKQAVPQAQTSIQSYSHPRAHKQITETCTHANACTDACKHANTHTHTHGHTHLLYFVIACLYILVICHHVCDVGTLMYIYD